MGKESELWDDSALIKAFDNAITKYKTMHSETYGGNSTRVVVEEEEEFMYRTEENEQNPTEGVTEACLFSDNSGATTLPPIQNNQLGAGSSAPVPIKDSTSGPVAQENFKGHVQSLAYAEYSQKLSQYYELEEQRQKLLHELNQANYWNYQNYSEGSGSYLPQNEFCAASQSQLPPYHGSYPYCPACSCHCLATSCVIPTCAMGDNCSTINGTHAIATACKADPVGPFSCSNDNIIKAAKEAAEKAISSMKLNTSMTSGISINEENTTERKEGSDAADGGIPQNSGSETDLTVVLNAWFSAGFYTGRYLSEQSFSKNQP